MRNLMLTICLMGVVGLMVCASGCSNHDIDYSEKVRTLELDDNMNPNPPVSSQGVSSESYEVVESSEQIESLELDDNMNPQGF